ncbi:MAG: hypothetical protein J6W38_09760 [Prevotella sp.]|nr:hypothetical protein [Prevotella sp.]
MKYLNKIASILCSAALGILVLTSCEGADLYTVGAPNWLSEKADSIAAAKAASQQEEVIEGLQEDVYDIGTADLKAGFWTLGKTYVVPAGQIWKAQFNLLVNPDNMYYKNFYVVLNAWNGTLGDEFGVIRFDNDPTKNSEWNTTGTEIDRSLVGGNFSNSSGDDSIDPSVQQMNGKITLTVDRTNGGLYIEMTNGTLTKTYTQKTSFPSTGSDADICCRIGVEGSLVSFLGSTIEPIGGFTSREDKQPEALILNGVPRKILQGTPAEEAFANVTATIQFEQGVSKNVNMADLTYQVVPNMSQLGKQTLIAAYAKTYKGEAANAPVIGTAEFEVVDKMYITIGASDNTSGWWSVHSDKIKVNPDETFVSTFTNYTSGVSNWNNFVICLTNADGSTEYGILRADNWGWGTGWAGEELASKCTPSGGQTDWATWLSAMDGAKVTVYVTNNGDGTCDVRSTMIGNDGNTYHQDYIGLNTVTNPDDFYFHYTVDNCHLEFNEVLGNEDNTTGWWVAHSTDIEVPAGMTYTTRFKNYTNGADNWNNFLVVLTREDNTEYTVLRADNYGWGDSYASCTPVMEDGRDWATWLSAMDGATVTVSVTNNGTTADVKCVMLGNDGVTYKQDYLGISPIEANNFRFRFTVEGGHLVFE